MSASNSSSSSSTTNYTMMTPQDLASLRKLPGNLSCIDCGKDKPEWASVTLAVFMCLECSGQHRALGSHVSFVRSIKMDSWSTSQLERMRLGGNTACQIFLAKHGIDVDVNASGGSGSSGSTIRDKYDTPAAQLYQQVLKARIDGTPEPTELPRRAVVVPQSGKTRNPSTTSTTSTSSSSSSQSGGDGAKKVMEGFGSSPVPEPSRRDQRRRAVLGVGVAAVGAIAIGLAASKKKWNQHKQQQKQNQQSKYPATVATQ